MYRYACFLPVDLGSYFQRRVYRCLTVNEIPICRTRGHWAYTTFSSPALSEPEKLRV
ncbi:hypothetical protein BDV10DRAFT_159882 [Aspergillus recurvatus]